MEVSYSVGFDCQVEAVDVDADADDRSGMLKGVSFWGFYTCYEPRQTTKRWH